MKSQHATLRTSFPLALWLWIRTILFMSSVFLCSIWDAYKEHEVQKSEWNCNRGRVQRGLQGAAEGSRKVIGLLLNESNCLLVEAGVSCCCRNKIIRGSLAEACGSLWFKKCYVEGTLRVAEAPGKVSQKQSLCSLNERENKKLNQGSPNSLVGLVKKHFCRTSSEFPDVWRINTCDIPVINGVLQWAGSTLSQSRPSIKFEMFDLGTWKTSFHDVGIQHNMLHRHLAKHGDNAMMEYESKSRFTMA